MDCARLLVQAMRMLCFRVATAGAQTTHRQIRSPPTIATSNALGILTTGVARKVLAYLATINSALLHLARPAEPHRPPLHRLVSPRVLLDLLFTPSRLRPRPLRQAYHLQWSWPRRSIPLIALQAPPLYDLPFSCLSRVEELLFSVTYIFMLTTITDS